MFNKIFKFLKNPNLLPSEKQKIRIFLGKDLRQYRIEYFNIINHMVGKNWTLGNKSLNFNNLKLIKIFKILLQFILIYYIFFIILY